MSSWVSASTLVGGGSDAPGEEHNTCQATPNNPIMSTGGSTTPATRAACDRTARNRSCAGVSFA